LKLSYYFPAAVAIIAVNILGYVLELLSWDSFIILLGFRFHISLVVPFVFILRNLKEENIKKEFTDPDYKKNYPFLIPLVAIPSAFLAAAFFSGYSHLGDPEYFYEFGLSSLLDLPLYLVWNSPQIIMFYFFLQYCNKGKLRTPMVIFAAFLPFAYYFIPSEKIIFDTTGILTLFTGTLSAALLILKFRNLYWFVIFLFMFFWLYILLYGSSNPILIKILFASQYKSWEGFFTISRDIKDYSQLIYVFTVSLSIFIISFFRKSSKVIL
jgi:hypothetical protein